MNEVNKVSYALPFIYVIFIYLKTLCEIHKTDNETIQMAKVRTI